MTSHLSVEIFLLWKRTYDYDKMRMNKVYYMIVRRIYVVIRYTENTVDPTTNVHSKKDTIIAKSNNNRIEINCYSSFLTC